MCNATVMLYAAKLQFGQARFVALKREFLEETFERVLIIFIDHIHDRHTFNVVFVVIAKELCKRFIGVEIKSVLHIGDGIARAVQ